MAAGGGERRRERPLRHIINLCWLVVRKTLGLEIGRCNALLLHVIHFWITTASRQNSL